MDTALNFYIAAFITAFCCIFIFISTRSSSSSSSRSKKSNGCNCTCSCSSSSSSKGENFKEIMPVAIERQGEGSMMEQLVPEITTHTLSYLDYPSLCRLSMTNSSMRKAANDDSAWKILYHKDFTVEQDTINPPNGWKSYYAATRAIVNVNAEFYNIIRDRSLQAMRHFWLRADYIKCIHGTGELFTGYDAVIQSWQQAFGWDQGVVGAAFQVRDVKARLMTDMAWLTMKKAYVDLETEPLHVTNVYEFHNGQWYMVHHHSSLTLANAEMENQNVFG
ncbi:F-box protein skip8 [Ranunculus cassubicifolius]